MVGRRSQCLLLRVAYVALIFHCLMGECWSINLEGLSLLKTRDKEIMIPDEALVNWKANDGRPCRLFRVHCEQGHPHSVLPLDIWRIIIQSEVKYGHTACGICRNRKVRLGSGSGSTNDGVEKCCDNLRGSSEVDAVQNGQVLSHFARRMLLDEWLITNLEALPAPNAPAEPVTSIITMSSGFFPATGRSESSPEESPSSEPIYLSLSPPVDGSKTAAEGSNNWKYIFIVPAGGFLICFITASLYVLKNKEVATIGPWKTGLSGQLQKALVTTGVPRLNRSELETACEGFSNVLTTVPNCTIFKGTLSSGVEIAVAMSSVSSAKDWSKLSEQHFRQKIDTFSRINHKNFLNLLGYCKEVSPFLRVMVYEYAPNGSLFEHLHVKEVEHLDWPSRMRIMMGIAYCLQHMHHEVKPPIVHSGLQSKCVFLMDDYAAKVTEVDFWEDFAKKGKICSNDDLDHAEMAFVTTESNVYDFGILMLELISGRLPYSEEHGSLIKWLREYMGNNGSINHLIDPTLKFFKNDELDVICEVIQECICEDSQLRPTMKEVTRKLREVIDISPDAANPHLSPLWWAELEILSEAS